MMTNTKKIGICALVVLFSVMLMPRESLGGGFALYEWSARGQALGGAMTARADEASAVAYNPAGITQLEGWNAQGGLSLVSVSATLETTNPYDQTVSRAKNDDSFQPVPHVFLTGPIGDRLYFGLGTFVRFGLGVDWPDDWDGRYAAHTGNLVTASLNSNLAYKVTEKFSVAIGLEGMYVDLSLDNALDGNAILAGMGDQAPIPPDSGPNNPATSTNDIQSTLEGSDFALGYNIGAHYVHSDRLAFGAHFRRKVDVEASGDVSFRTPEHLVFLEPVLQKTGIKGKVTLPDMFFTGVLFRPRTDFSIELGAIWTRWSLYERLRIDYKHPLLGREGTVSEKKWNDAWRYVIGAEWNVTERVALRVSYVFDETPVEYEYSDYLVPDSDRHMYGIGIGYSLKNTQIDLGYSYVDFDDHQRGANLSEGILATRYTDKDAHKIALSISRVF